MSEQRILTEDEALRLLAHFFATADLHLFEGPYYTERRILEGVLPLVDALIHEGSPTEREWLQSLKSDLQHALAARSNERQPYEAFVHQAPGRVASEIKRRQGQ